MQDRTLGQYLRYLQELGQEDIVIETPPLCQALWERARAEGCRLGQLYVLRRPLFAGAGGAYDPRSGDIWVLHDPRQPRRSARTLLHELAHARQPPVAPAVAIDAYCDEEAVTEERVRQLAVAWGVPQLLDPVDGHAALDEVEELRAHLTAAGELAGTLHLTPARQAYSAVRRLAAQEGWTRDVLSDALFGFADHSTANVQVLDFDRCALRSCWRLVGGASGDFGRLTLVPDEVSASLLRSGLQTVANRQDVTADAFVERGGDRSSRYHFAFLRLEDQHDLAQILAAANAALLANEQHAALATWDCFGDAADTKSQRLYRLWVQYGSERKGPPLLDAHLWILALPRRCAGLRAEAALQQYIASWRSATFLRVDCWWRGLAEFATYEQTGS